MSIRRATHKDVPPVVDKNSRVLVLGSMLSPKSAEVQFYYAHPQNRFWRVLYAVFDAPPPDSAATDYTELARFALSHGIALWDVAESCTIDGALDSTITDVTFNDISGLLHEYPNISAVYATGKKAYRLLMQYNKREQLPLINKSVCLPSTSPLNCACTFDALVSAYSVIAKIEK